MPENEFSSSGEGRDDVGDRSQRMTNEDFRRLLMTPRASATPSSSIPHTTSSGGPSQHSSSTPMQPPYSKPQISPTDRTSVFGDIDDEGGDPEDRAERRRKKKSFYAKLKKQEEDKMAELAKKYRDRARERREGANPDYQSEDPLSAAGGYRAVAPDVKSGMDAAERRRQMIQESKFLGGDMEHTHLVKGLDYALLQKVRSEIQVKEQEEEDEMECLMRNKRERRDAAEEEDMQFKTSIGRSIYRAAFKNRGPIERNELFSPGRTAYVIELEEEGLGGGGLGTGGTNESDIPTTLIRSRADVPSLESAATLTTNDIVINKLAQILSYLRQGTRHSRRGRKKETKVGGSTSMPKDEGVKVKGDDSIYGDIGDYIPGINKRGNEKEREKVEKRRAPYFEKPEESEELGGKGGWGDKKKSKEDQEEEERTTLGALIKTAQRMGNAMSVVTGNPAQGGPPQQQTKAQQLLSRLAAEPQGYAECYPGLEEMQDAIDDSDDEVDYTKMDLGNKKGPIGRWDFDTQEEYSEYMNSKEALPKAAFQYGVKMADGRRTRKYHREKNEKAELDREWQKIQNIIQKRKGGGGGTNLTPGTPLLGPLSGAHKMDGEPDFKVPRY